MADAHGRRRSTWQTQAYMADADRKCQKRLPKEETQKGGARSLPQNKQLCEALQCKKPSTLAGACKPSVWLRSEPAGRGPGLRYANTARGKR